MNQGIHLASCDDIRREWLLKRNCSLSPRQVGYAYGLLCLAILGIGLGFALAGLWMVLGFALLETLVLALALLHYARHAGDREHLSLREGCLLVERIEAGRSRQIRLDPCWIRIAAPGRQPGLIALESRGVKVEVGMFVSEEMRRQVASELRRQLRGASFLM